MDDLPNDEMAAGPLAGGFRRQDSPSAAMSDPVLDTPMVVTLDQLRSYEHNPRVTRNPRYDEIKASIRERGLDSPPAITRRPGEIGYIIRNGGNTRLAILRELWAETREERFLRIPCLFRPWPERGEIIALTGHLAENELRGSLTFIERALGVEKACELYEAENGKLLSQSELSRRLAADGYPVPQPHISRMREAVSYLLPAIPSVLYGGLGRPQIERLTSLRKAAQRLWDRRAARQQLAAFPEVFQDVLAMFDGAGEAFSVQRVQDELLGQLAGLLNANYDTLALELEEGETWQQALLQEPSSQLAPPPTQIPISTADVQPRPDAPVHRSAGIENVDPPAATLEQATTPPADSQPGEPTVDEALENHIVSPGASTERLRAIQRLTAEHLGEPLADFASNVVQAIPVQAGGLYPISDIWFIEAALDEPGALRVHIAQLVQEIATEAGLATRIEACDEGIGYRCRGEEIQTGVAPPLLGLLSAFCGSDGPLLLPVADLATLLLGGGATGVPRLSDAGLIKLFRVLRLARRLLELEVPRASTAALHIS